MKTFPRTKGMKLRNTLAVGPHGLSLELRKIPRRTVVVIHELQKHNTPRYDKLGGVANRATRRAYAKGRGRGKKMPAAVYESYEKPALGTLGFEMEARIRAGAGVPVFRR